MHHYGKKKSTIVNKSPNKNIGQRFDDHGEKLNERDNPHHHHLEPPSSKQKKAKAKTNKKKQKQNKTLRSKKKTKQNAKTTTTQNTNKVLREIGAKRSTKKQHRKKQQGT